MLRGLKLALIAFSLVAFAATAIAGADLSKVKHVKKDDGILRLTSNKNALLKLDQDAVSVIVNNPEHASVMLDTPRLLIVIPHQPGATSFTVLDANGNSIMQKDVIVTNVQEKYVRIRRMCASGDSSCADNAYFYCPDGCYEVTPVAGGKGNIPPAPSRPAPSNQNAPAVILDQN